MNTQLVTRKSGIFVKCSLCCVSTVYKGTPHNQTSGTMHAF